MFERMIEARRKAAYHKRMRITNMNFYERFGSEFYFYRALQHRRMQQRYELRCKVLKQMYYGY
ncbi:hypothetical protein P4261_28325 [Bacillus thuringiensis]|nr:hypothetical protein [Bacillus thuringiensis]MED2829699.1 hypothetical protein [Bacillus thuringiensis]MED2856350.1 hypothetical protein [Bacillus thuringiensis]MED2863846.1 hypothetical protein [Bacillus thuringiensis]